MDMLVRLSRQRVCVELKYKKVRCNILVDDERFDLNEDGAKDYGSHDFIKDIMRIEHFIQSGQSTKGHAILLTNDARYWNSPKKANPIDRDFHLIEGRVLHGRLSWAAHAGEGSMKKRKEPIQIRGRYTLNWRDFPSQSSLGCPAFRYLQVEIT